MVTLLSRCCCGEWMYPEARSCCVGHARIVLCCGGTPFSDRAGRIVIDGMLAPDRRRGRGFTVIELLIAMVIVGILASIAFPLMLGYVSRSKVTEGMTISAPVRREIELYWSSYGNLPGSNDEAGVDAPDSYAGAYVLKVEVSEGGVIQVTYADPALEGKHLLLTPRIAESQMLWQCTSPDIDPYLLPKECQP